MTDPFAATHAVGRMPVSARSCVALLTATLAVAWVPSSAGATDLDDFNAARSAFDAQRYDEAARRLEAMVGDAIPRIRDPLVIPEARKYLAATYLYLRRRRDAEFQFEQLLRDHPDSRLDPVTFSSEVIQVFDGVRERLQQDRAQADAARARAEAARQAALDAARARRQQLLLQLIALAQEEVVVRHELALALLPYGAGQFQNGNQGLGLFFLATELGLTGLVAGTAVGAYLPPLPPRGTVWDRTPVDVLMAINWIASGTLLVMAAVGIVEALISFRPEQRTRRDLPNELLDPELLLGAGSVGLEWRF